jgi:hypothetical protein
MTGRSPGSWLPNRAHISYYGCQMGPSVSYILLVSVMTGRSPGSWLPNWLQGNAKISKPLLRYLSYTCAMSWRHPCKEFPSRVLPRWAFKHQFTLGKVMAFLPSKSCSGTKEGYGGATTGGLVSYCKARPETNIQKVIPVVSLRLNNHTCQSQGTARTRSALC